MKGGRRAISSEAENVPVPGLPIRVLLTVPHLSSTASPYREMMAIAEHLPGLGFHLTICSLRKNGFEETEPRLTALGIPVFIAAFRPRGRRVGSVRISLRDQTLINRRGPFDIQHSLDFTTSAFEAVLARWYGRPFVFSQRNMNTRGSAVCLRLKTRLATHAIAVSSGTRRLLEQHGATPERLATIYNGIDADSVHLCPSAAVRRDGEVILCVGQIVRLKRPADAVRAFAMLAAERPTATLQFAGRSFDQPYYEELLALSKELRVSDRVELLGERRDVPELMRNADVLILCSESEGLPWVIIEAMAAGLPVVSSDAEGPKEILEGADAGVLVPVGDVQGYANALRRILGDRGEAGRMAARARAMVEERFSARSMVAQLASLYRKVARSN